jgi:hypothetical protein
MREDTKYGVMVTDDQDRFQTNLCDAIVRAGLLGEKSTCIMLVDIRDICVRCGVPVPGYNKMMEELDKKYVTVIDTKRGKVTQIGEEYHVAKEEAMLKLIDNLMCGCVTLAEGKYEINAEAIDEDSTMYTVWFKSKDVIS